MQGREARVCCLSKSSLGEVPCLASLRAPVILVAHNSYRYDTNVLLHAICQTELDLSDVDFSATLPLLKKSA